MAFRPVLAALAACAAFGVQAAEIAGVKLDDRTRVGAAEVVLNGAGIRKRVFISVYAIGLYLPEKKPGGSDAIGSPGAKRVAIHMLRDVDAASFAEALIDGMKLNHDEATMKALEPRITELSSIMNDLKEARKGTAVLLDWQPGAGTLVTVDGKVRGKPIAGEDFYRALLRIWLGERPVQDDLKKALLGG